MNNTAKLYYMSKKADVKHKKPLTEKDIFNLCHDKWIHIKRANDPSKTICHEAIHYIAALEFLFQNTSQEEITFTRDILIKKSHHKTRQRARFLEQIGDLYNIQYHTIYNKNGKKYHFTYSAKRTENALKILENPKKFYREEAVKNGLHTGQKRPVYLSNLTAIYNSNRKDVEEIENISTKDIFSISNIPIIKTTVRACAPAREETPPSKPRIRVAAISERMEATTLEQSSLLCSPCGAASQISSAKEREDKTCLSDTPKNNDITPRLEIDRGFTSLMEIIADTQIVAEEVCTSANDQNYEEPPFHKHSYLTQHTISDTVTTSSSLTKERFQHDLNVRKIKIKIRDSFDDKSQAEEVILKLKIEQPIPGKVKLIFPSDITLKPEERYKLRNIIMNVCGKDINIVSNLKVSDVPVTETFDNSIAYDPCYVPITQRVQAAGQIIEDKTRDLPATIIPMPSTSCGTKDNVQNMEDLQSKVENSPQISWSKVKQILATKQKFYRLDNVVVTESLRKITISHQYTSALDLIDRDLGIHLRNIAEEFNIQIILLSQQDKEVAKYEPGKQKYEVTADDLKYMKSLKENKYSAIDSSPFPELVERLEEFIATGKIEEISNE